MALLVCPVRTKKKDGQDTIGDLVRKGGRTDYYTAQAKLRARSTKVNKIMKFQNGGELQQS